MINKKASEALELPGGCLDTKSRPDTGKHSPTAESPRTRLDLMLPVRVNIPPELFLLFRYLTAAAHCPHYVSPELEQN